MRRDDWYWRRAYKVQEGDSVAVFGLGGIGLYKVLVKQKQDVLL